MVVVESEDTRRSGVGGDVARSEQLRHLLHMDDVDKLGIVIKTSLKSVPLNVTHLMSQVRRKACWSHIRHKRRLTDSYILIERIKEYSCDNGQSYRHRQ